jgi:hypothetical protein
MKGLPELNIQQKSILATALLAIAFIQLIVIIAARGQIGGFSPQVRRWLVRCHRFGGYLGLFIILLVAYSCVFYIGARLTPARVAVHAVLGLATIALIMTKISITRGLRQFYTRLPVLGAALFSAIVVNWLVSAGWYFFGGGSGY